ncbi:MAG: hypothetical protein AB7V62_08410 [Thermoleophilia bacterium]
MIEAEIVLSVALAVVGSITIAVWAAGREPDVDLLDETLPYYVFVSSLAGGLLARRLVLTFPFGWTAGVAVVLLAWAVVVALGSSPDRSRTVTSPWRLVRRWTRRRPAGHS